MFVDFCLWLLVLQGCGGVIAELTNDGRFSGSTGRSYDSRGSGPHVLDSTENTVCCSDHGMTIQWLLGMEQTSRSHYFLAGGYFSHSASSAHYGYETYDSWDKTFEDDWAKNPVAWQIADRSNLQCSITCLPFISFLHLLPATNFV